MSSEQECLAVAQGDDEFLGGLEYERQRSPEDLAGFICTLPLGHDGPHEAHGCSEECFLVWVQAFVACPHCAGSGKVVKEAPR